MSFVLHDTIQPRCAENGRDSSQERDQYRKLGNNLIAIRGHCSYDMSGGTSKKCWNFKKRLWGASNGTTVIADEKAVNRR